MSDQTMQARDIRGGRFYWIGNEVLRDHGRALGPYGIAVYNALCYHTKGNAAECEVSAADLAKLVGMSPRQAWRELEKLERLGLVSVQRRTELFLGQRLPNVYSLLDPVEAPPALVPVSHRGYDCEAQNTKHDKHLNTTPPGTAARAREAGKPKASAPAAPRPRDPGFDRFCRTFGYDPDKPAARIRGLAGDHAARCRRLDKWPTDADWRRWVEAMKRLDVKGAPAWGSVVTVHNATDKFLAWWELQAARTAPADKDLRFWFQPVQGGAWALRAPGAAFSRAGIEADPEDPKTWPQDVVQLYAKDPRFADLLRGVAR